MARRLPHPVVARLDGVRMASGLSLRELAGLTGAPITSLHNWFTGVHSPRVEDVSALAEALGCRLALQVGAPPLFVDEDKVATAVRGGRVSLNRRELREAAERLDARGASTVEVALRLGVTARTVRRWRMTRQVGEVA